MKTNSATSHFSLLTAHLLALVGLSFFCSRLSSLPQIAKGGDVLSVAFGDAREVISRAAIQKADSYFHGGIDTENSTTTHFSLLTTHTLPDPWHWIDSRIRAPQEHRHLEGAQAVELLPWFWAAVKSDPHNAEAWAEAWYIAAHEMKDKALAARVIAEAKAANPESIEIAFTEGRALYDGGKGDLVAAKKAFARARMLGDAKGGGDVLKLTVREEEAYRFAGNYLKSLNERK